MVALVTGANRGIGLEVAKQLSEKGYTVIAGSRDLAKGQKAVKSFGASVVAKQLDVSDKKSTEKLFTDVQSEYGVLDVLVNNAAINYDTWHTITNADLKEVHETFETNFFAPWHITQTFLPLLGKSKSARVVMVSSGSGSLSDQNGGTPGYSLSKLALNGLTLHFAKALKSKKILVNAVCPGWVATDMGGGGRPIPEGAAGVVWAATLKDNGPTGGFFRDGKAIDW
jgi:NAD(P)-dependent dehydrogenase (short-subunit alcohol dehydrogenase family)